MKRSWRWTLFGWKSSAVLVVLLAVQMAGVAKADEFKAFDEELTDKEFYGMVIREAGERMAWICSQKTGREWDECEEAFYEGAFDNEAFETIKELGKCFSENVAGKFLGPDGTMDAVQKAGFRRASYTCRIVELYRLAVKHGIEASTFPLWEVYVEASE